jgi:hypothetical protein
MSADIVSTDRLPKEVLDNFVANVCLLPQVKFHVEHYFGPNIYIREIIIPAGHVIVGKAHKTEHLCSMVEGRMLVVGEDGVRKEISAPAVFMAGKGRKMAYAIETVRFQNIFSTPETDINKLEAMLVEEVDFNLTSDMPSLLKES